MRREECLLTGKLAVGFRSLHYFHLCHTFSFPFLNSQIAFSFCTIFCSAFILLDLCYRQMLYELSENITNDMLKDIIFLLKNCLPKRWITLVCEERQIRIWWERKKQGGNRRKRMKRKAFGWIGHNLQLGWSVFMGLARRILLTGKYGIWWFVPRSVTDSPQSTDHKRVINQIFIQLEPSVKEIHVCMSLVPFHSNGALKPS